MCQWFPAEKKVWKVMQGLGQGQRETARGGWRHEPHPRQGWGRVPPPPA